VIAQACPPKHEVCSVCGIPQDSEHFDISSFAPPPAAGREIVLARFELTHQYCGVLELFSQFTDEFFGNAAAAETPAIEWRLQVNGRPLNPYGSMRAILNPWGFGSFGIKVRLPEAARLELIARGVPVAAPSAITRIGGRIAGRYWFNPA
jgi:hypothetical protein